MILLIVKPESLLHDSSKLHTLKKMKKFTYIKILSVCMIFLFPAISFAQSHLKKANQLYEDLSFAAAVPEYEKAIKSDPDNSEAVSKLAHCYRLINDSKEAERWYSKLVQMKDVKPSQMMYYTQALMSNGNYPEAEVWIKKYTEIAGSDSRSERILQSLHELNSLIEDSANYLIEKLSINSPNSDCSPVFYKDGIVFSSSRKRIEMFQSTHEWTGLPFFSLYYAKGKENTFEKPEEFAPNIMTKYNNGSVCFNSTYNELYITRNSIDDGKVHRSDSGVIKLKIYHYKKSGSKWVEDSHFPFNSDNYNCAHPYLSKDGDKLFFASDMPGGYGGLDLYYCMKSGESWGQPVNLGPAVNTYGNDAFPFIDNREGLFFASDGRGGLGGYDVFYSPKNGNGYYSSINLGYPINSSGDDLGWTQNEEGNSGYFSSNRVSKNENDDIYMFNRMAILLNVLVYDAKTNLPLTASTLKIIEGGQEKRIVTTSDSGTFNFLMTPGKEYHIITEKEKYQSDSVEIETADMAIASTKNLSIGLNKKPDLTTLEGKILSSDSRRSAITDAKVRLVDSQSGEERFAMTSKEGKYKFDNVPVDHTFRLDAKKKNFVSMPIEITPDLLASSEVISSNLVMNKANDIVTIDKVYYDCDKYFIRPDAEPVLTNIYHMMESNPKMRIELRSHTDCRSSDEYNQVLSEKRAKAAVDYLVKKGIDANRLVSKGFGESMPVIPCDCSSGKACSESDYQKNRRTEFKILSLR
jgi:outer membrane protein OmpA-like peptidoglycan-associated protein/tetratricopeptide (TPR) repeat protein